MNENTENNDFNIDEALAGLEEINNKLSDKNASLDESIKLYNEGSALAKKCQEHLEGVATQLQILNDNDRD